MTKHIIKFEENISQDFRLKKITEKRNYLLKEINQNELMSNKHKNSFRVLNYTDHLLIVISTITVCVSISAFASLVGTSIGITSSSIGLKISATTAGIKKYTSMIKKKKKKHDKIVFLAKYKLNSIFRALISKALIDWNISHDEFVLVSNVLKEFYDMKRNQKFKWQIKV